MKTLKYCKTAVFALNKSASGKAFFSFVYQNMSQVAMSNKYKGCLFICHQSGIGKTVAGLRFRKYLLSF
jgi:hypothetical protein